jgi:hypothetical protein
MDLHVKFDSHEIIITRPGTDMMTAYRKAPERPNLVLTRSWVDPHNVARDQRVPRPRHSGCGQQGPRARVDCLKRRSAQ